ncbi:MAG TPA: permease prefix domain 2-containing transporter [Gemmatimonadaceae bacterium]|nr:permease prefix domain 2-containing transporter [Gemmatimonadaceae bacterium]
MSAPRATPSPAPRQASPPAEALLRAIGAEPAFAEAVLGDLAEEYALRASRDGEAAARWWYAREALRSTPHLIRSAARHARRHRPALVAAWLAGGALAAALVLLALFGGHGPPAQLVVGTGDDAEGVVLNHLRPVQLPARVLDAKGHPLERTGVHYQWTSGAPVSVSASGVVTCTQHGDATVRASLGPLATHVLVRCRPVREVRATVWNDFVLGDPARELPVDFVGVDGHPVTLLSARVRISDSTIATLEGLRIRPLSPGRTHVEVSVGDRGTSGAVRVFAPVRSLAALRPDQRLVAAPVRLARGDSIRWPLPVGLFNLVFLPDPTANLAASRAAPTLRVDGPVMCMPAPGPRVYNSHCLARGPGATVTAAHPGRGAREIVGRLAIEWEQKR